MPMAICQTEKAWLEHPHGSHLAKLPIVPVDKISPPPTVNGATPSTPSTPFLSRDPERPLTGLKVITLTHAIAGPSTGRTLAEHGASVLQIMFTHGFEHAFVYTYANLGTASARLNLHKESDRQRLWTLVKDAHVWIDSYREGAISKFGFTDEEIWKVDPGMIITHVRCYGTTGPWAWKPGFDMQGSASSGMMYLMGEGVGDGRPQWLPGMVVNDYTTGYFGALAIMGIILKRCRGESDASEGWTVSPSLCGTAMGTLKFFKTSRFSSTASSEVAANIQPALAPETLEEETPLGYLKTLAPLPKMSLTPLWYEGSLLQTMGSSKPIFPGFDDDYDVKKLPPAKKDNLLHMIGIDAAKRLERLRVLGRSAREKRD